MTEPATQKAEAETGAPLFDVVVRVPSQARLEDIEQRAVEVAGIAPDRVQSLMKVLRSVPEAKIGAAVTKDRADKAQLQFGQAGLEVIITPVLSLQTMITGSFDNSIICPACDKRMVLTDTRQCPHCGVFVDKVTEEVMLKRKITEAERARIEAQMAHGVRRSEQSTREAIEAAMRAQIRAELEKEYGIKGGGGFFGGRSGLVRATVVAGLLGAAFVGGNATSGFGPWAKQKSGEAGKASQKVAGADVDKMLASIGPAGGTDATGAAAGTTGDPDVDDPLIQAAGGKRIGARGLSVEQAVAAAQTLAKAVGNTTAERAMAGGGGPPAASGVAATSAAGAAADTPAQPAAVPKSAKLALTAEFAQELAAMGQANRAREVLKAVKSAADPASAGVAQGADLVARAWAMQGLAEAKARSAAESIKNDAAAIADPAERSRALSQVAVVLSRHPQLSADAARAFMTLASEALKAIADPKAKAAAAGDWAAALGEVLLSEATARARDGGWSKVNAASAQLELLIKEAPDNWSQARLYAIDYQMKQQLGQFDKAAASLDRALAQAALQASMPARGALLRRIGQLSGAHSHERLQAAVDALQSQAEAKSGMERAQTLTQVALFHADAGLRPKADQVARLAQATTGLSEPDSVAMNTDLIVRVDLASARAQHALGLYADAEQTIQRVGGYLL